MLLPRLAIPALALLAASAAAAQGLGLFDSPPDPLKRYPDCMALARSEPIKALPVAEKWQASGGGPPARHCAALALFEAGRYGPAATALEAIAHDMGHDRPGLRAELWAQAGQAYMEAGMAERAADVQSRALDLKSNDPDLWLDRGLSYAALRAWPRAISDFDRALKLRPDDVEVLVLRAAAWRNAGDPARAFDDAQRALKLAPDHSEARLERGFANLARGERSLANDDFNSVLRLAPSSSAAARRAQAGLRGEQPAASTQDAPSAPPAAKGGGKR
jgi:tetratricopeptide (TPR) repeat protein